MFLRTLLSEEFGIRSQVLSRLKEVPAYQPICFTGTGNGFSYGIAFGRTTLVPTSKLDLPSKIDLPITCPVFFNFTVLTYGSTAPQLMMKTALSNHSLTYKCCLYCDLNPESLGCNLTLTFRPQQPPVS